jgi:FMN reductase
VIAVLGSVTPPGRLHAAVSSAADRASALFVDLAVDDQDEIVAALEAEDAVLLATPVYRGTYSGVLKVLLDATPVRALRGKPVGIAAMGATDHHSLGADWHLRDVLAWYGAFVAPTSVYLTSKTHEDPTGLDALFATLAALAAALPRELGPPPLAALKGA